ncbi:MAG: hypothetical protein KF838_15380 [Phycisphaeraceae bacterium]|nr:MAG: hypothetical protein KF838_15380 [Phycisphaeraceae bacterium]
MKSIIHPRVVVALLPAMLAALNFGGTAMADITKVYVTPEYAEANFADGTRQLGIFTPVLTVTPLPASGGAGDEQPNSLAFYAEYTSPGLLESSISGNNLDSFPPPPIASPGIYLDGGLKIENVILSASGNFRMPGYDDEFGTVSPAQIAHGTFGDYRLDQFGNGEFAYVAYCRSDRRQFGYVQYAYIAPDNWRLIGYAYGGIDEPVTVTNLVPAPAALGLLGAGVLIGTRRRERECAARR